MRDNNNEVDDFELELRSGVQDSPIRDHQQQQVPLGRQVSELKPTDRGRDAWQLLIAAFIFEALFWGFPNSYGIFQAYYSNIPQFTPDSTLIPVIGTVAQGFCWIGAPLAAAATKRFPRYQRHMIYLGWPLCIFGLLTASFCKSVKGLLATQGVAYGFGFVTMTYPIVSMINEWWVARKGMAFGLISAASGLTGIVMPIILETLLQKYGYETTLRACAVAMFILTAPLIPLLKGRLPPSEVAIQAPTDWSFLHKPLFWLYGVATVIQGLGFAMPSIFISSYAISVGLPTIQAASLLAIMSTTQTLGQFAFGWLSDTKLPLSLLTSLCCVAAAISTALCWGLGKSLSLLVVYSMIYGFFAYGFGTMRVAMGRAVTSEQSAVLATYSTFVFLQGIGVVIVGPLAAALLSGSLDVAEYGAGQYKQMIMFVAGSSMMGGMVIVLPRTLRLCTNIQL